MKHWMYRLLTAWLLLTVVGAFAQSPMRDYQPLDSWRSSTRAYQYQAPKFDLTPRPELTPQYPIPRPDLIPHYPTPRPDLIPHYPTPRPELTPHYPIPRPDLIPHYPTPRPDLTPIGPTLRPDLTTHFPIPREDQTSGTGVIQHKIPTAETISSPQASEPVTRTMIHMANKGIVMSEKRVTITIPVRVTPQRVSDTPSTQSAPTPSNCASTSDATGTPAAISGGIPQKETKNPRVIPIRIVSAGIGGGDSGNGPGAKATIGAKSSFSSNDNKAPQSNKAAQSMLMVASPTAPPTTGTLPLSSVAVEAMVLEGNDHDYIWIRFFEKLGARITWVSLEKPFTLEVNGYLVQCRLGQCQVTITKPDGNKEFVTWTVCPFLYQDKVYVPLRDMAIALNLNVEAEAKEIIVRFS